MFRTHFSLDTSPSLLWPSLSLIIYFPFSPPTEISHFFQGCQSQSNSTFFLLFSPILINHFTYLFLFLFWVFCRYTVLFPPLFCSQVCKCRGLYQFQSFWIIGSSLSLFLSFFLLALSLTSSIAPKLNLSARIMCWFSLIW